MTAGTSPAVEPTSELRRSFGWRVPTAVVGLVATFLVTVVAVRVLGALDSALFLSALLALNFGPMVGRLGLGQNALRLIPAAPDADGRRRVAGVHLLATLLLAALTAPVVALLSSAGAIGRSDHLMIVLVTVLLIVLETVRLTLSDVFAAYGAVRWSVAMTHHVRSIAVSVVVVAMALLLPELSVLSLLAAYGAVASVLLLAGLLRARELVVVRGTRPVGMIVRAVGTGALLFATDLAAFAVGQGVVWTATSGLPAAAAAQYATAAVIALQVTIVESLAAIAVMPVAARLWAAGQRERMVRILSAVATLSTAVTAVAVLMFVVLGPLVLRIAYGPEMEGAYLLLVILTVGGLAKTSFGINIAVLVISGHARRAAGTAVGVVLVSVPAALLAVSTQDARWLAAVACAATVLLAVAQWLTARTVIRPAARPHVDLLAAWRALTSERAGD